MFNAPIPPQFPPALLALIAAMRGGQMAQPPAFGQQPGLQQPPPGFFGQQPQLEQPPGQVSPLAAAAGGAQSSAPGPMLPLPGMPGFPLPAATEMAQPQVTHPAQSTTTQQMASGPLATALRLAASQHGGGGGLHPGPDNGSMSGMGFTNHIPPALALLLRQRQGGYHSGAV